MRMAQLCTPVGEVRVLYIFMFETSYVIVLWPAGSAFTPIWIDVVINFIIVVRAVL